MFRLPVLESGGLTLTYVGFQYQFAFTIGSLHAVFSNTKQGGVRHKKKIPTNNPRHNKTAKAKPRWDKDKFTKKSATSII